MSETFLGITFPWQKVTPSDDGAVRKALLSDGILFGCGISYSGSTLTMQAGQAIACGRQFHHTAVENWAITGATSGYARLLLTLDLTGAATETTFEQIKTAIEYASSVDGFPALQQENINDAGTYYQISVCVVSLGTGGITGIVSQWEEAGVVKRNAVYTGTLPASGWAYEVSSGCYTQTISIEGLLASDDIVFDLNATSVENQLILADEWAPIYGAVPSDGSFFIRVRYLPSIDVPVQFMCVRG